MFGAPEAVDHSLVVAHCSRRVTPLVAHGDYVQKAPPGEPGGALGRPLNRRSCNGYVAYHGPSAISERPLADYDRIPVSATTMH